MAHGGVLFESSYNLSHVILKFLLISFDIVKEELHGDFFLPLFNFKSISEVYL